MEQGHIISGERDSLQGAWTSVLSNNTFIICIFILSPGSSSLKLAFPQNHLDKCSKIDNQGCVFFKLTFNWRIIALQWCVGFHNTTWLSCKLKLGYFGSVQFSSVAQLCLTLYNPMDHGMPGFPVHHQLPQLAQTHVHRVGDAISSPVVPSPPAFNLPQHQGF